MPWTILILTGSFIQSLCERIHGMQESGGTVCRSIYRTISGAVVIFYRLFVYRSIRGDVVIYYGLFVYRTISGAIGWISTAVAVIP